jgi:hypothetical protein
MMVKTGGGLGDGRSATPSSAASQILTLYTTPLIYIYFDKLQAWVVREKGRRTVSGNLAPSLPSESQQYHGD